MLTVFVLQAGVCVSLITMTEFEYVQKKFCVAKNPSLFRNVYLPDEFTEKILEQCEDYVIIETFLKSEKDAKEIRNHVGEVTKASFVIVGHATKKNESYKRILFRCHHGSPHNGQVKNYKTDTG